jgi:hypothetical protein
VRLPGSGLPRFLADRCRRRYRPETANVFTTRSAGPYAIGTVSLHLIDNSDPGRAPVGARPDLFGALNTVSLRGGHRYRPETSSPVERPASPQVTTAE